MAEPVTIADIYALFQASRAEDDRRAAEADRRAAESERQLQELKRVAANTSREVAGLTTRWGQFVENLVAPAVIRLFQERGIEVQELSRRMQSKRPGAEMEIDIFAVDGDVAVAVEVKSRLSKQDVDDFLARLGRFRQAFPHYTGYQIHGAVAGIEIDEGVDRYAYQQGLFVIKQMGDTVAIANDTTFQPAAW
ncbi:hypothetical protein [Nodosilinea nodulosa]|uniref:hypothetical protein n=1 Tax=Nodosilinea nodulosa TaxID=416001 RepID=UPI0002F0F32F|nr:hypothetical protein [Nodosilinea nodulosa]